MKKIKFTPKFGLPKIFFILLFYNITYLVGFGQVTIVSEGLNNSSSLFTISGGTYYSGSTDGNDEPTNSPFAVEGSYSSGVSNGTQTLTSSNINTSLYTNISLSFRLAAFGISGGGIQGLDAGDYVRVEISPNGGTNYYNTLTVTGYDNNTYWAYNSASASTPYDGNGTTVTFAPANSGDRSSAGDGYSNISITNLPAITNLRVRITILNNDGTERWCIDDFKVTGFLITNYYSFGNTNPNNVNNWWTNTNGTGSHPSNFTTNYQRFIIQNGHNYTTSANWTVSGTSTSIEIQSGGTLTASYIIDGTSTNFELKSGGNLIISNTNGITTSGASGAIQVTGTRTYSIDANYTYNGTSAQATGNGLTGANNLTINNTHTNGVTLTANTNVSGTLTLSSGILSLGTNNLTLGASATVSGFPTSSNMVVTNGTGQFIKTFNTGDTPSFTFPIGETTGTTEYSPVTLDFSANTLAGTVGVRVTDGNHSALGGAVDYLSRYWTFTTGTLTNYTYNLSTYNYLAADVNGLETNMKLYRYTSSAWTELPGSSVGSNQISITSSLNQTTGVLNGSDFTAKTSTLKSLPYSHNFDTQDDWTTGGTANIWERGDQTNDSYGPPTGHSGNTVYGTKLNAYYGANNISAYLYTPSFSMSGITSPRLNFWMDMEAENGWDGGILQVSVNGGAWTTIQQSDYLSGAPNDLTVSGLSNGLGWTGSQPSGEWQKVALNLFSLTGITITNTDVVQFRFWFGTDGSQNSYPGWYIDDFRIYQPNDQTTIADAPTTQIPAGNISSITNSSASAVSVFKFDITDQASGDGLSTFVTTFDISNEGTGTADWTNTIAGAELWADGAKISNLNISITDNDIIFTKSSGSFEIADGTSKEFTLKIWLNTSNIVDNSTLKFQIPTTSHGFVASETGSEFATTFPLAVNSNTITVTVNATELRFTGQPASTATSGVPLTIQPIVKATDIYGNTDIDVISTVTLSNSGGLTMLNNSMTFVAGVANFGTPNNFQFTTGGKYVFLNATDGTLSSLIPSYEIAVDIIGCEIFSETFNSYAVTSDLPSNPVSWAYNEITTSVNDWGIATVSGANRCLTIYNDATAFQYSATDDANIIAYRTTPIDARGYREVTIDLTWQCAGQSGNDYGQIMWSTDGISWSIANSTQFYNQATFTTGKYDISCVDNQQFYIGFRWVNNTSTGTNPPFAIDNISIKGKPDFDYNFSYRLDEFESIIGTIVIPDANDGVNISLPSGFDFKYDGVTINNVRANINGWIQMGTSHTSNAESNNLISLTEVPFLAPLWDDLTADGQTRIIYNVVGEAPTRVFTVEWLDVLWGTQRQNFQVKLYETSYIIEFWYGIMNSNLSGSASIGINNSGSCMNKLVSVSPNATPSASYTAENNNIKSIANIIEGMVFIFNPLNMQKFYTWQNMDLVIGQPNFTSTSLTVNQSTSSGANSSAISSKGVLAVGSGYANRILIWTTLPETNGEPADIVIGQSNFTSSAAGTTSSTLDNPSNVAFSPDGTKLIVADASNNRVLIWNTIPTSNGQAADVVIGQTDFVSSSSGCTALKLYYPTGVLVIPDGRLIITDGGNNRVLIYNAIPVTNGASADVVIGQPDFTTSSTGSTAAKLDAPWDCAYTPEGKLLISDDGDPILLGNHRILVFNDVPETNGASADLVIGNTVFGSKYAATTKTEFNQPSVTCSVEGKLAIADFGNSRIMIYDRVPAYNGAPADFVLGQPYFETEPEFNNGYDVTGSADARNMYFPYSINFDLNGKLYVNGTQPDGDGMNRVMVYGETPIQTSDLEVTIVSDAVEVCVYNNVEYSVEVINHGPDDAYSVTVNAQLPRGFTHIYYKAQDGSTYNSKSGYWSIPYIANGDTARLVFSGEVQPDLAGNPNVVAYANTLASSQKDNDFSNNAANSIVAIRNFYSPTISKIPDQYVQRNSNINVLFTVGDEDGLSDISSYTATSTNTTLLPVNYLTNIVFGGSAPNKDVNLTPVTDQYGYTTVNIIVTDNNGCNNDEDFLLTVGNFWEGDDMTNGPTEWDQKENWSFNVPTNTLEAIIPTKPKGGYFPIIDVNGAECLDLVIEPKATITLNDSYGLIVNNNFYIQSDITGTGSFVDLNHDFNLVSIYGSIYIQRYFTGEAWHYISSPLNEVPNTTITANNCGVYNGNLIVYNEAFATDYDADGDVDWFDGWEWPWYYSQNSNPLVPCKGYAYYSFSQCNRVAEFSGSSLQLNTGNYTVLVTNQDQTYAPTGFGPHRGWNLLGNPYPSGLDANDFISSNNTVIDNTIYFWDEGGMIGFNLEGTDYASYNPTLGATTGSGSGTIIPDKYISISQGFFVHRTNTDIAGTNINFSNSMRENENSAFYSPIAEPLIQKLKLSMTNGTYYNELIVGLLEDATMGIDSKYDGYKLEGNVNFSFYSLIDTMHFVNQGIPTIDIIKNASVKLGFNATNEGTYKIELRYFENIPDEVSVYLEDTYENVIINLRNESTYSFSVAQGGRFDDRFILHFNMNNAPVVSNPLNDIQAYEDELLYVQIPSNCFEDYDQDVLSYTLTKTDGSDIPDWMTFDKNSLLLTINPSNDEVGTYNLRLKATDVNNTSASFVFAVNVINVNDAPILLNPINDVSIDAYSNWNFTVPENTFIDIDKNDELSYSAFYNASNLPLWLLFDDQNGIFTGNPTNSDIGEYYVTLRATDLANVYTENLFKITVKQMNSAEEFKNELSVYPNPSNGLFSISSDIAEYTFEITDVLGRIVYSNYSVSNKTSVDLTNLSAGTYFIKIIYEDTQTIIPITIQ